MDTGVARGRSSTWKPIAQQLARAARSDRRRPAADLRARCAASRSRVVFAEGEEEQVIRAAASLRPAGPRHARCWSAARTACARPRRDSASSSAAASRSSMRALSSRNAAYAAYLYERLQRHGYLLRDCQRLVNQDRNHFAACMVALGDADAMVTGVTRNFSVALEDVRRVHRSKARPSRHRRLAGAGARPHRRGRRHRRHRNAGRRGHRRDRHRGGGRGARARL